MGFTSRSHKPNEWAAKINHTHIINDPVVKRFVEQCSLPKSSSEIESSDRNKFELLSYDVKNPIKHILAVDGGYTTADIKKNFPSAQFAFFQFGAVLFSTEDLDGISEKPYIFPEDIQKLHNLKRFKLVLPIKNIVFKSELSLKDSVRRSIYEFFIQKREDSSFMETLK